MIKFISPPTHFSVGEKVKLVYKGSLYKNKADEVYAHIGYVMTGDTRRY
jgi:phosphate-selective porin